MALIRGVCLLLLIVGMASAETIQGTLKGAVACPSVVGKCPTTTPFCDKCFGKLTLSTAQIITIYFNGALPTIDPEGTKIRAEGVYSTVAKKKVFVANSYVELVTVDGKPGRLACPSVVGGCGEDKNNYCTSCRVTVTTDDGPLQAYFPKTTPKFRINSYTRFNGFKTTSLGKTIFVVETYVNLVDYEGTIKDVACPPSSGQPCPTANPYCEACVYGVELKDGTIVNAIETTVPVGAPDDLVRIRGFIFEKSVVVTKADKIVTVTGAMDALVCGPVSPDGCLPKDRVCGACSGVLKKEDDTTIRVYFPKGNPELPNDNLTVTGVEFKEENGDAAIIAE